jgi:hypothetical protein
MSLPALQRERLKLLARIAVVGAAIGAIYGVVLVVTLAGPGGELRRLSVALSGAISGLLISGSIGAIEMLLLRAGPLRRLNALPFLAVALGKCVVYGAIVIVAVTVVPDLLPFGASAITSTRTPRTLAITVAFSLAVTFVFVTVLQAATLLGRRAFRDLVFGRYRRPRAERRFFLFVDVVGSSAIAAPPRPRAPPPLPRPPSRSPRRAARSTSTSATRSSSPGPRPRAQSMRARCAACSRCAQPSGRARIASAPASASSPSCAPRCISAK